MKRIILIAVALLSSTLFVSNASALTPLFGNNGLNGLGAFEGSFDYSFSSDTAAEINISLKNTSPGGTGYITAFVFNNPSDLITNFVLEAGTNFGILGGPTFDNSVNGASNGQFDVGLSTGNSYTGSGNPNKGIGVGETESFRLFLTGTGLDTLNDSSFFDELSVPPGAGEGLEEFVVRFRGFQPDGSDKVPNESHLPEPASIVLFSTGLAGLLRKRFS